MYAIEEHKALVIYLTYINMLCRSLSLLALQFMFIVYYRWRQGSSWVQDNWVTFITSKHVALHYAGAGKSGGPWSSWRDVIIRSQQREPLFSATANVPAPGHHKPVLYHSWSPPTPLTTTLSHYHTARWGCYSTQSCTSYDSQNIATKSFLSWNRQQPYMQSW